MAQACDALAAPELALQLEAHGVTLGHGADLQVWLIVDARSDAEGAGETAVRSAQEAVYHVESIAWQRLRLHMIPHLLVLAEPVRANQAAVWVASARSLGADDCLIAGPVDALHLRLDAEVWKERAAHGLAALLWGRPDHLAETEAWKCRALGGAAWRSPLPALKRWLTHQRALEAVQRLAQGRPEGATSLDPAGDEAPPWRCADPWLSPERHQQELAAQIPAPVLDQTWRRRPNWPSLGNLPAELRDASDGELARQNSREFALRQRWVVDLVAGCELRLAELGEEGLSPAQLSAEIGGLRQELQQALVRIEDWLEGAARAHMKADGSVERAQGALQSICDGFPPATFEGVLSLITRPWRWLDWAWAYLMQLPRAGQQMLAALRRQARARWEAANLHALRQAYLAMAQAAGASLAEAERMAALLSETENVLSQTASAPDDLAQLAPWTSGRLTWLAEQNPPGAWPDLGGLSATSGQPAAAPEAAAASASLAEAAAANLLAWAADTLGWLDTWTAADCLRVALPDGEREEWIARFLAGPAPLWPEGQDSDEACWILVPDSAEGGKDLSAVVRVGRSLVDAALALRLLPVRLAPPAVKDDAAAHVSTEERR
jgi:hypothetical protein